MLEGERARKERMKGRGREEIVIEARAREMANHQVGKSEEAQIK